MRDIHNNLAVVQAIDPQVVNSGGGAKDSGDIDLQGFKSAEVIVNFGTSHAGDTLNGTNKYTVKLEHKLDGGSYEDVAAGDVLGVTPDSGIVATVDADGEDEQAYKLGYIGGRRYIRVTVAPNGTLANGCPIGATLIKGHAELLPVS